MKLEEVHAGEKYKIKAPNATGWYEIREIREFADTGKVEIIVKGKEAFVRTVGLDQLIAGKPKEQPKRIVSAETTEVIDLGKIKINIEDITYWPDWGRRGRPRKNAK